MNILFVSIALVAMSINSTNVSRCFIPGSPKQGLEGATAVFAGKVVGREYVPETLASGQVIERLVTKIAVQRVWKGDISTEVIMHTKTTLMPNGMTGFMDEDFDFDDGSEYFIYALGDLDHLYTNVCTRTRNLINARDDLKQLGKGRGPKVKKAAR